MKLSIYPFSQGLPGSMNSVGVPSSLSQCRILYTSLIDRTVFVLLRALIWILGNISLQGVSLAQHVGNFLNPFGVLLGLDGVILLAYIIAILAN
ncbi:MAG: hypothetical protein MUO38_09190 [Anaerolineales bacterium]|nr:hypothetical protein [Anaerolineales bacterium]